MDPKLGSPLVELRPSLRDLHLHDLVRIHEGPLAQKTGILYELKPRTAVIRIQGMFRRDVLVEVPLPFVAQVDDAWLESARARLPSGDPLAYIDRQISTLRQNGLEYFDCRDPERYDAQVRANWVWFSGMCETGAARAEGLDVHFCVNVYAAKVPVLLISRDVMLRAMNHKNANILPVGTFKEMLPKHKHAQVLDAKTCYRGRRYDPKDIWWGAERPHDTLGWYKFRRGHYLPGSVQFVGVPELGAELTTSKDRRLTTPGKINLTTRSMCYAMMLLPVTSMSFTRVKRWGLLSAQYHQLGVRTKSELALLDPAQVGSVRGEL